MHEDLPDNRAQTTNADLVVFSSTRSRNSNKTQAKTIQTNEQRNAGKGQHREQLEGISTNQTKEKRAWGVGEMLLLTWTRDLRCSFSLIFSSISAWTEAILAIAATRAMVASASTVFSAERISSLRCFSDRVCVHGKPGEHWRSRVKGQDTSKLVYLDSGLSYT